MTVTGEKTIVGERRPVPGLPGGIERFTAVLTIIGDASGGNVNAFFAMNPDLVAGFSRYLAVSRWSLAGNGVTGDPAMGPTAEEFEDFSGIVGSPFLDIKKVIGFGSSKQTEQRDVPVYLGRSVPSTAGRVIIRAPTNTDLVEYVFVVQGWVSDRPFLAPTYVV